MADLFDMKVGGAGWHVTSHLIALVALFVACFAITGYISFRDLSVPGSALKDHDANFENVEVDSLQLGNLKTQSITTVAADEAVAASTIATGPNVVLVTVGVGANDRFYLPSPTEVALGKVYVINVGATGCEMSSKGDGVTATTINGTAVTTAAGAYAAERALAAQSTTIVMKTGANAWSTMGQAGGTPDA